MIREIADEIPPEIDWVLRVDGHTDSTPVSADSQFRDNWELSQARALSVVRYMTQVQGLPPDRLAATGFGEYQPIDPGRHARGAGAQPPHRAEVHRAVASTGRSGLPSIDCRGSSKTTST